LEEKSVLNLMEKLKVFSSEREWDQFHSPKNLSIAIAAESAELLEEFMWLTEAQSRSLDESKLSNVKDEVGDVLLCLLNLCNKLQLDPIECAYKKLDKNNSKYPVELSRGIAKKYNELGQMK
jgi:dCTP diphosphatase